MCSLCGRTLLDHCLDVLGRAGISRSNISIVTGYRSNMFQVNGVIYFHNADWEKTNMFHSLTMAREWLERETCIVCYSDIVFAPETIRLLADCPAPLAITSYNGYWNLWKLRMENPLEDLETFRVDGAGRLLEIGLKPNSAADIQGQFMGLLRFTPESWGWVEETIRRPLPKTVDKLDMTTLLQGMLRLGYPVQTISTEALWLECDSERDIEVYEQNFAEELSR